MSVSKAKGFLSFLGHEDFSQISLSDLTKPNPFNSALEDELPNAQRRHLRHCSRRHYDWHKAEEPSFSIFKYLSAKQQSLLSDDTSPSLKAVLQGDDVLLFDSFYHYLCEQKAEQLIHFLIEVVHLRAIMFSTTQSIFAKYLQEGADSALNMSGNAINKIAGWCHSSDSWGRDQGLEGVWLPAIDDALAKLRDVHFPNYLSSPNFQKYQEQTRQNVHPKYPFRDSPSPPQSPLPRNTPRKV